jgi:uncharacterized repeat protein (TIGR02543 family)
MKRQIMILLACLFALYPISAYAQDAHFFIRYDHSNVDETGSTHYSPAQYFPVGSVAEGYKYGSNGSDYSSVDGQVKEKSAFVEGAEAIISQTKINIYNSFGANASNIETIFNNVYSDIIEAPSQENISSSILAALGKEWQERYDSGQIKILWYVVKDESPYVNVDGVLYYVSSGNIIDKENPEPEPIYHTIEFVSNSDTKIAGQTVKDSGIAFEPEKPTKDGYTFDGWYIDESYENKYDFATPVTSDIILYAKWLKDNISEDEEQSKQEEPKSESNSSGPDDKNLSNGEQSITTVSTTIVKVKTITTNDAEEGLPTTDDDANSFYWALIGGIILFLLGYKLYQTY